VDQWQYSAETALAGESLKHRTRGVPENRRKNVHLTDRTQHDQRAFHIGRTAILADYTAAQERKDIQRWEALSGGIAANHGVKKPAPNSGAGTKT
jgi:hypothetical protein